MRLRRPFGLQGWLVAAFVAVGAVASLVVLLVLLPSLDESAIRNDRATRAVQDVRRALEERQHVDPGEWYSQSGRQDLARRLAAAAGGEIALYDDFGNAVGDVRFAPSHLPPQPGVTAKYTLTLPGHPSLTRLGGADEQRAFASVPLYLRDRFVGVAEAAVQVRDLGSPLSTLRRRVFGAVAAVLLAACLAGAVLARVLGGRMRRLAGTAARLAGGELSARAPAPGPRELAALGGDINRMAARLEGLVAAATGERDRAKGMIASLAEGVLAVGPSGELTEANTAARHLLDLPDDTGRLGLDALPLPVADAAGEVLRDPARAPLTRAVAVPGAELVVQVTTLPDPGAGLVVTLRDVTDERRLERARRDLVANVSHELKTPLTALKGFLELLEDPALDEARRREFIALMAQETERLERLVEEQLELARLDAGGVRIRRERVDLAELARRVAGSRRALAEREGIALGADADGAVMAQADPARVEQVLMILLDNALRHTPAGGAVRLRAGRDGNWTTVAVEDTGEGIPIEAQPFVFDRFYRADPSRQGRGAGLGLAIARGIARAHGGAIELRSAPGAGSTFTLRLPAPAYTPVTQEGERPRVAAPAPPG